VTADNPYGARTVKPSAVGEKGALCRNGFAESDCAYPCIECGEPVAVSEPCSHPPEACPPEVEDDGTQWVPRDGVRLEGGSL
jgi:hypothetical protein